MILGKFVLESLKDLIFGDIPADSVLEIKVATRNQRLLLETRSCYSKSKIATRNGDLDSWLRLETVISTAGYDSKQLVSTGISTRNLHSKSGDSK